jgi:predicted nucleic acid-binding protein
MRAYLDLNVVMAITKNDFPNESTALNRLVEAYDEEKVELVTSTVTLEEIKRYRGPSPVVERTFRLLEKVPIARWDELVGIRNQWNENTCINVPVIQNDPLYEKLLKLGLEVVDARHVFVAAKNECQIFLTCDGVILDHRPAIEQLCGLVVQKPSDFVASQGW